MKRYIDADKLIANLERQNTDKKIIEPVIRIIASLQQEQVEVDFDEEFDKFHIGMYNPFNSGAEIYEFALHFYELGLNARKEE